MNDFPELSLVVPVYNEQDMVGQFVDTVSPILESTGCTWEMVFVNDGSSDATMAKLQGLRRADPRIKAIDFSRNFGKEAALTAGLDFATGRAVIPMDVDLQDPPELIPEMIIKWREGWEVVLAARNDRSSDTLAKRTSARWFYSLFNRLSPMRLPENVGDFRLMDRVVVDALKRLDEKNRFMKGLMAWAGFSTTTVEYSRPARAAGCSKWNFPKLFSFALDGIFSFSNLPLKVWTFIGTILSGLSFLYMVLLIGKAFIFGRDVPGYHSIMVTLTFLGGVQLISLGVIGEYVGRIYNETKGRPIYLVKHTYGVEPGDEPGSDSENASAPRATEPNATQTEDS
ncbi:MAG: glycosyltransferase [Desulfovibrio sp.]|nr:MAG: glycosyltransferase [Desulfovibrio sp.]